MKAKRRLGMALCCLTMCSSMALASGTPAYASNHENRSYDPRGYVSATSKGSTWTKAGGKTDTTKVFNWNYSVTNNANHTAEAAAEKSYEGQVVFVGSPMYGWSRGKSGYLTNYIKEKGYNWATIWFNNTNSFPIKLTGVWSPDSRGY